MSLRIRRGLDADRLTITPEEGEFLYTLDTNMVYIGDGVTVGGNLVAGGSIITTSDDITEGTVHLFLTVAERAQIASGNELAIAYAVAL